MDNGSEPPQIHFCDTCKVTCTSDCDLKHHKAGRKHKLRLKTEKETRLNPANTYPPDSSLGFLRQKAGGLPHRTTNSPLQNSKTLEQCLQISHPHAPVIGLQHVVEFRNPNNEFPPHYLCKLCKVKGSVNIFIDHIAGVKHCSRYLATKPEHMIPEDDLGDVKLNKKIVMKAKLLEQLEGRGVMKVIMSSRGPPYNNSNTESAAFNGDPGLLSDFINIAPEEQAASYTTKEPAIQKTGKKVLKKRCDSKEGEILHGKQCGATIQPDVLGANAKQNRSKHKATSKEPEIQGPVKTACIVKKGTASTSNSIVVRETAQKGSVVSKKRSAALGSDSEEDNISALAKKRHKTFRIGGGSEEEEDDEILETNTLNPTNVLPGLQETKHAQGKVRKDLKLGKDAAAVVSQLDIFSSACQIMSNWWLATGVALKIFGSVDQAAQFTTLLLQHSDFDEKLKTDLLQPFRILQSVKPDYLDVLNKWVESMKYLDKFVLSAKKCA
ncbi:uncharacterized protein LOC117394332 isoform X2 [Acipenser ruthenus]|uniref:uncharacterized protein LOC117394332 isoform X2 n=1 Tax=Acipenser ruthenus TaxID=7906 RepID=UPI002741B700|nr:uncharacterized protein LOC117394332 isoform X2 [Acipenser ruthenus]